MNISEVVTTYKRLNPNGHFFDKDTLSYFGQTLADFKVIETEDPSIVKLRHTTWWNQETPFEYETMFNMVTGQMESTPIEMVMV